VDITNKYSINLARKYQEMKYSYCC